ncbi:MAG: sorbosone dehydrogenase family protein [Brevundimonas sp.]|uniref:PQQ-dependent sugar dehydrogenase n=1 Tax=Brevundimonas sp. TaxID=1871086 RepID=UPI002734252A|nr:sorbosone dehydrogenase family protein [Brevundimonas sp.]MDP3404913.1 sorbosone dehydrogenase family protein [Brevundimonas sp.]
MRLTVLAASLAILTFAGCAAGPIAPEGETYGPDPALVEPTRRLLPVINIARAVGWPDGIKPVAPAGFAVQAFASGLDHPRWLYRLPNGDILVAETNAPPKPEVRSGGIRGWIMGLVMKRAGAAPPSANRITLLRDADGDGVAETRTALLENLSSPFGMALVGDRLFVANADAVVSFPYVTGQTRITAPATPVAALPAGRNHHWTKSLVASPDGTRLYVGVGSNSNIGENGLDEEVGRAAIHEIDIATGTARVFASGLRNPVGMAWQPDSGALWVAVNERDELGNDLVPDYMTSVQDGGFYGWPWSYFGQIVDSRVSPPAPERVAAALSPDYALGAHTASLGLTFYDGAAFPAAYARGAFVGQHGSWNRTPRSGYKVIFVPFSGGRPSGPPQDFLTGFLTADGEAMGRPVGVQLDSAGALLVADDVGNVIWRVSSTR